MPLDVVAVPRSRRVVLAAVLGEAGGKGKLALVAEDGARFRFPGDRALVRVEVDDGRDADDPASRLAALRQGIEPFDAWLALRSGAQDDERLTLDEVARRSGRRGPEAVLAVALGVPAAAPWFRRDGAELVAVPMRAALERLFDIHQERFREVGDATLKDWWPRRAEGLPQEWLEVGDDAVAEGLFALERARFFEPDYHPDPYVAGAAALQAVVSWALGGEVTGDPRGRDLARALGLPDDPDQVLEQLVACGALPDDVEPAPHRAGLMEPWKEEALADAERVAARPIEADRLDLTHEFAVAVDDPDTREVDDAVTLRIEGDRVDLLVHVADVAAHVAPGTPLDTAVRGRASSLFLPDHSLLMFPPDSVVKRLSLAEGEPREALTGIFRLDDEGRVEDARFVRSLVRVTRRVAYEETTDPAALAEDADTGRRLVRVCEALRVARERRGARVLRLPSIKVTVEDGEPRLGHRLQDSPGDVVVSEAMVLHNTRAGELLAAAGAPALYRGQSGEPRENVEVPEPGDPLYAVRIRKTFAPTQTSVDPIEHAGLGAPAYAQCTSPLRRYGDLVNQRQLAAVAEGHPAPHPRTELSELAPELRDRERAVRHAANARTQQWVARAVAAAGRETLHGVLSRPPRRGLGSVWVPELCRELPLRAQKSWRPPEPGTESDWRISTIRPFRGRIELAPA